MNDVDAKVRNALRGLADRAPVDPMVSDGLRRRVRRRRVGTVALAGTVAAAVVVGAVFGVNAAIRVRANSTQRAGAGQIEPWPGLYPATTYEEAEQLQACADAGTDAVCGQYVNVEAVIRGYAIEHLGWPGVYFTDSLDTGAVDESGPLTVQVGRCSPIEGKYFPKGCILAEVTVERLLRRDVTGVWFVTGALETIGDPRATAQPTTPESSVRSFVDKFMGLRFEGAPQALTFLSATAKSQYDRGDGGLALFGEGIAGNGYLFDHFEITSIRAADADSFEVDVAIQVGRDPGDRSAEDWVETLFVGAGEDYKGDVQPLVIRGATLTSKTPRAAP
jgi:hypothetical protein